MLSTDKWLCTDSRKDFLNMQPNYDTPYRNETFYETIEASRISNVASRQAHSYADERSSIWNFVRPKRSAVQYGLNATDYVNNRVLEKSGSDILERNTDDDDDEWENDSDTTIIATSTTSLHDSNQNKKYVAHLVSCGNIVRVDSRGRYDASLTSYKQTLPKSTGNERLIRNPSSIKHQSDRECYDKVVRHISDYCDRQLSESDKNDGWSTIRSECDNRQHIAIIPREYSTIGHRPPTPDCPVLRVMRSGDSHYSTIGPNCTINSLNSAARSNPQQSIVPVVRRRIFNRLRNTHKEPSNTTPTIHAYSNPADRSVRELFDDLNHLSINNSRSLAYDRSCNSDIDNRTSQYLDAIEDAYTIMPLLASNTLRGESVTFPPADVNSVNLSQNGTLKSNIFRNTALRNGTLKPASFDLDNYDGKLHTLTKHDKKTRSSLNLFTSALKRSNTTNHYLSDPRMKSRDSDVPQRIEQLFSALYKGFSSFADLYRIEFNRLTLNKEGYYNNEIPSDTVGEEKLKTFEEAVKTYSELAEHVHDLRRQYEKLSGRHGAVNSADVPCRFQSGSASRLSRQNTYSVASVELELYGMVGRFQIDIKAIVGFARITTGDTFECIIRHGSQKFKTRGKTLSDKTQKWDRSSFTLICRPDCTLDVKISEVRLFSSKLLSERSLDPCDLFKAEPQLLTINLNDVGTLKLEIFATWIPIARGTRTYPHSIPSLLFNSSPTNCLQYPSTFSGSSPYNEIPDHEMRPPFVSLREKKRASAMFTPGRPKKEWRSSVSMLDNLYAGISETIPTVDAIEAMSVSRTTHKLRNKHNDHLLATNLSHSMSQLPSSIQSTDTVCCASRRLEPFMDSVITILDAVSVCRQFMNLLLKGSAGLLEFKCRLDELETYFKEIANGRRPREQIEANQFSDNDDLNDNTTVPDRMSDRDSGIFSTMKSTSPDEMPILRDHSDVLESSTSRSSGGSLSSVAPAQRRFKQVKYKERRRSLGATLDSIGEKEMTCSIPSLPQYYDTLPVDQPTTSAVINTDQELKIINHHLKRCKNSLKVLVSLMGPFDYKEQLMMIRLHQDSFALREALRIIKSPSSSINIHKILSDLNVADAIQEIWLSAARAFNSPLICSSTNVRRQLLKFFGPVIGARYPQLTDSVIDNIMLLLTDDYKWHPLYISVFQFVGLFRDKNPVPFIENVAHETWINKNLGSHQLYHIRDMMDRLLNVPIVPPLESLRHIALVLIDSDRRFQEIAEHYLKNARGQLRDDIVKGYLCLLEHDHAISRKAACRALYTLDSERGIWFLSHVAAYDRDPSVRDEAATALRKVQSHHDQDSSQVTRI